MVATMEGTAEVPREKLRQILEKNGEAILQESDRVEGLLRDHCGSYRKEISALVGALNERVPLELTSSWQSAMTPEAMRARLVQRLEDNRGLAPEVAEWAVEAWSYAVGVGIGRRSDRVDSTVLGGGRKPDPAADERDSAFTGMLEPKSTRQPQGGSNAGAAGLVAGMAGTARGDRAPGQIDSNAGTKNGVAAGMLADPEKRKKAGVGAGVVVALVVAAFAFGHRPPKPEPTVPDQTKPQATTPPQPAKQSPAVTEPPAVTPPVEVPKAPVVVPPLVAAGAPIDVRLNQGFSSDDVTPGQTFTATLANAVNANGKTIFPQGADAVIRIVSVDQAGKLSGRSVIQFSLVQISSGGHRYAVSTGARSVEGKAQIAEVGKRAGIGGAIGAGVGFIGGKLFKHGGTGAGIGAGAGAVTGAATSKPQPVVVHSEALFQFRLTRPIKS